MFMKNLLLLTAFILVSGSAYSAKETKNVPCNDEILYTGWTCHHKITNKKEIAEQLMSLYDDIHLNNVKRATAGSALPGANVSVLAMLGYKPVSFMFFIVPGKEDYDSCRAKVCFRKGKEEICNEYSHTKRYLKCAEKGAPDCLVTATSLLEGCWL